MVYSPEELEFFVFILPPNDDGVSHNPLIITENIAMSIPGVYLFQINAKKPENILTYRLSDAN